MNRILIPLLTILFVGATLTFSSCTQEEQNETSEPRPEGSVIEFSADWLPEKVLDEYTMVQITARVTNIGDDGVIEVHAEIAEGNVEGTRSRSTKLYLKRGEEKTIHFHFWLEGAFTYRVWCPQNIP